MRIGFTPVWDTHALIWFLGGDPKLGSEARKVLVDPASELVLPAMALAEALWIVSFGLVHIVW